MRSTQLLSYLAAPTLATASIENHNHPRVPGVGPHDLTAPTVDYTGSISTYSTPSSSQSPQSDLQTSSSSSLSSSSSEHPIDSTTYSSISVSPTTASTTLQSSQPSSTSPSSTAGQRPDATTSKPADATSTGGAILSGMQSGSGSVVGLLGFFIVGLIML